MAICLVADDALASTRALMRYSSIGTIVVVVVAAAAEVEVGP